jgi:hypothetical protein
MGPRRRIIVGMFDKIKGLIGGNADAVKDGVDKGGDMVDDKTGGKHTDHIDTATEKVGDMVDDVGTDAGTESE